MYACDRVIWMVFVKLAHDDNMSDRVTLLHSLSTKLSIPNSMIITLVYLKFKSENIDAGLLGDMIIPTLRQAWSDLLVRPTAVTTAAQPSNQIASTGHEIPCGATVYVCAVECQEAILLCISSLCMCCMIVVH